MAGKEVEVKIEYIEWKLSAVVNEFAKQFKPKEGKLGNWEIYIDHPQDKVVFKLYLEDKDNG